MIRTVRSQTALTYRPAIDGMRAIAVLGVVLYHAGFGPKGGFVGVDIFFVISGYLITSLLEAELSNSGQIDLAAFYARRVRRLLPALAVVLTVSTIAAFAFLSPHGELPAALQSVAASAVFGANVFFQYTTGDYFGPDVHRLPLLHLWSLGVEEQYYLVWPLALVLARRVPLVVRRYLFALCAVASLAFAEWSLFRGGQAAFYATPSRWWELSLGAVAAWVPPLRATSARWEGAAGLVSILVSMTLPTHHFPGIGAIPATFGAALLAHGSAQGAGVWRALASAPLVLVGRVSYPFYLWHWPLLAFAAIVIPGELSAATRLELVLVAFFLAVATWRWVEQPARPRRVESPGMLVGSAVLLAAAVALVMAQLASFIAQATPANDAASLAARDFPANAMACQNRASQPDSLPDEGTCALGSIGRPSIVIWGDSHAMALQPLAEALALRKHTTAIGYMRELCPPAIGFDDGEFPLISERCKAFNAAAIRRAKNMDTVILAARWPDPDVRAFSDHFLATLDELAPRVRKIFIIGPTPVLPARVPDCMRAQKLEKCALPRRVFVQTSAPIATFLSSLSQRYPNVTYVDPTPFFCEGMTCPAVRDGMALYWDSNHISTTAASAFARTFLLTRRDHEL